MKEWYSAVELAEFSLPGFPRTKRGVTKRAERDLWSFREVEIRGGLKREYHISAVPGSLQKSLFLYEKRCSDNNKRVKRSSKRSKPNREVVWKRFTNKSKKAKDMASKRVLALDGVFNLADTGTPRCLAYEMVSHETGFHPTTLRRWIEMTKGYDRADWWAVLCPGWSGRDKMADCSLEAWEYYKADYLRLEAPAATACYERLLRVAKEEGWRVPALITLKRRIKREIPRVVRILARKGIKAAERCFPPQKRDRSVFHALEALNADGHKFDLFIKWPDGKVHRPVGVFWQDLFSGKILSYRIDMTENKDAVRLSFGDIVEKYGIPEQAYLDNGRGFAAKWLTGGTPNRYRFKITEEEPVGLLTMLGVDIHWCKPYSGQSKPIERAFRDFCEYISKHPALSGCYTGNKPSAKPENYGSRAVPLEKFMKILDQEIIAHNARLGRRSTVCAGSSFDKVFSESYAKSMIRKATAEQCHLWLLAAEKVSSARTDGSVSIFGNRYWTEELADFAGGKLVVRFDPQRLHNSIFVYTLDGHYIGEAGCIVAAGFDDSDAAREHARLRKQNMKAAKQTLENERRMDAIKAGDMLPDLDEPQNPETKLVRPIFKDLVSEPGLPEEDANSVNKKFGKAVRLMYEERINREVI